MWAGVKLPGGQYRKREQLAQAHDVLRRIAAGEINARQLPENAALLARREHDAVPVTAVVLHLPLAQRRSTFGRVTHRSAIRADSGAVTGYTAVDSGPVRAEALTQEAHS